jgi:hypothetical protein
VGTLSRGVGNDPRSFAFCIKFFNSSNQSEVMDGRLVLSGRSIGSVRSGGTSRGSEEYGRSRTCVGWLSEESFEASKRSSQ